MPDRPLHPEALAALAAQQLNALAQRVHSRLGLTLAAGADVRDYVAAQCSKEKGAEGLADCCERIFRALSEYCLQTDTKLSRHGGADRRAEGLQFALNGAAPADLFGLLPAAYTARWSRSAPSWMRWWGLPRSRSMCSVWQTIYRCSSAAQRRASRPQACPCT